MEISEFTLKLIIILIPGAIATIIYEKLTIHKNWKSIKFFANIIFLGAISYIVTQLFFEYILKLNDTSLKNFWDNLAHKEIPFSAIWKSSIMAVFVGFISSGIENYKLFNKIGKKIRLTNKYGDENLFSFFLNAKQVKEVYVRDMENKTTYHGMVESFSETDEIKEIVLSDVAVYNFDDAQPLYSIDKIYLSKPKDNLIIELPNIKSQFDGFEKEIFSIKIFKSTYILTKIKKNDKKD